MKLRPTTKAKNKRIILINYAIAVIFFSVGMYTGRSIWYVGSIVLVSLSLFRKYWLMKRLKE